MNIEAYDIESLRKIIRDLEKENKQLREALDELGVATMPSAVFSDNPRENEAFDPDQGARIIRPFISEKHAVAFFTMFWGRKDVYAKRGRRGGYFPQCVNRWRKPGSEQPVFE